ncbi:helix-turn-helix domain-containing protein, partial [Ralstonia pseudosolanacearum]|uniref:helix-turn-helix domain-containing protein n=1 Tax=Ralstonia pseudosolanacearum TaxID=1310165 RepID=UPI003D16B497
MNMADLRVYSIEEVTSILQVTRRSVYSYIRDGKLKAVKIGKYWRVTQQNLEDFLSKGTKAAPGEKS